MRKPRHKETERHTCYYSDLRAGLGLSAKQSGFRMHNPKGVKLAGG